MKYKYIEFCEIWSSGKTCRYECHNIKSGEILGIVKWYGPWRQYCFHTIFGVVFNKQCLADIQDFLEKIKDERNE